MSSRELSTWWALWEVHAEDAKHARDVAESGDGQVIVYDGAAEPLALDEDDDGGE